MAWEFAVEASLLAAVVTLAVATTFVYFAAKFVLDRTGIFASFFTVLVGTILSTVAWALVGGGAGVAVGLIVWAATAAVFFRTRWIKGAIIGVVAWALWAVVNLAVDAIGRR